METSTINQNIFRVEVPPILTVTVQEGNLSARILDDFLSTVVGGAIGLSATFGAKGVLSVLALSTSTKVLKIRFSKHHNTSRSKKITNGGQLLKDKVLCNASIDKLAFDMERICTAIYHDHKLYITRALDLQSLVLKKRGRKTVDALLAVLGGEGILHKDNVCQIFMGGGRDAEKEAEAVALRAWASWRVSALPQYDVRRKLVSPIDTTQLDLEHLMILADSVRVADRLSALKPTRVKNDVNAKFSQKNGDLHIELTRFKTRIRRSNGQTLHFKVQNKDSGQTTAVGHAKRVKGKLATISLTKNVSSTSTIVSVYSVGKEEPTDAEEERTDVVLACLQLKSGLLSEPLSQKIFFAKSMTSTPSVSRPLSTKRRNCPMIHFPGHRPLNTSQSMAVQRILSDQEDARICLIHGPPGTGKTTVIAASVMSLVANPDYKERRSIWLIAQSNVAVKNIAEKLANVGFLAFKLLVSFEFHFDWHEHLYEKISENIIRTDVLPKDSVGMERLLRGFRVILCTLSMISNSRAVDEGVARIVPFDTVIVDEASQIEIGDYLPLFSKHGKGLRKLAFVGDDKQLAPYGQDDIGDLRSIFEFGHLQKQAVFLDTQYRMPGPIGSFISRHVYNRKLKTQHAINSKTACRLVDVHHGKEVKSGNSWQNIEEAHAVVHIAQKYHSQGKQFRVITPYDAQRNLLENKLKSAGLPWENKCFNIDSFQGNEEDHIILSVVRSEKVGFLKNHRRSNVMLSRCKESMVICTSRVFLSGDASSTLLGKLATEWGEGAWLSWRDIIAGRF